MKVGVTVEKSTRASIAEKVGVKVGVKARVQICLKVGVQGEDSRRERLRKYSWKIWSGSRRECWNEAGVCVECVDVEILGSTTGRRWIRC